MENFDFKKYLLECMQSTEYCCLGTQNFDGVWTNPVYFAWDQKFNLYFISLPNSRHMKNLEQNPALAVAIYNTAQSTHGDVCGIQLSGVAQILKNSEDVAKAYDYYFGRVFPETKKDSERTSQSFLNEIGWQFVKITPTEVYYFDTRYFSEEQGRQLVPPEVFI